MWLNGNVCPQHVSLINTVPEETDTTTSEAQHNSLWSLEWIPPSSKGFFFSSFPDRSSVLLPAPLEMRRAVRELEIRAPKRERKWKWNPIRSQSAAVCQQQPLMQAVMGNVPGAMEWGIERGVRWPAHWVEVESAFTASITETLTPAILALHHIATCPSSPSSLPFPLTSEPLQFLSFILLLEWFTSVD